MTRKRINRQLVADTYNEVGKIIPTAQKLGISEKSVRNILKELGVKTTPRNQRNRRYRIDDEFFEKIDTQEKAYVLGFIWGDGSIVRRKSNTQLRIEISTRDKCILENIRLMMKSTHPIVDRERVRKGSAVFSSILAIGRKKIVNDLVKLGFEENKNEHLCFPQIDKKYNSSFILGLSDSDGSVGVDKENRAIWTLISTDDICNHVKSILLDNEIVSRIVPTKYNNLSRVTITRKSEIIKLRQFLYESISCCLGRKKDLFFQVHYKKGGAEHG